MKIVAYLIEPAKYTVELNEQIYKKYGLSTWFYKRTTQHNNKEFTQIFLKELPLFKRWCIYYQNWRTANLIISNGYLFDFFVISFLLNILFFRRTPIAIASDTPYLQHSGLKGRVGELIKKTIFRFSFVYGFSAGSKDHQDFFIKYGMSPKRVYLMPFISINYELGWKMYPKKNDQFIFMYVGRLVDFKRIDILIREFSAAFGNREDVRLRIVGDGPLREELMQLAIEASNVEFAGKLFDEALERAFMTAHTLVLASVPEMWGLVVNEALSAGMPVLVSKYVGSRQDLVENRATGLIFDSLQSGDLAEKMKQIYSSPENYERMSRSAYELMHHHWNYDYYERCFVSAIQSITSKRLQ